MTTPALVIDRVGDLIVTATSPVLQERELHPDADRALMSCFGDPQWDLFAALPDRHSARQSIRWDIYPAPFRHACKLYVFALVNIVEHPPRLPNARSEIPGIKTIWSDLVYLRVFLTWLVDRGIIRLADTTEADLDDYCRHILDKPAASAAWKRKALVAVQRLHAYRHFLPEHCRLPAPRPWGGANAAELADHPGPQLGENRTPRIHPDVMGPLLSAALLVVDTIAADLIPVARRLIALRQMAHQVAPDARRRTQRENQVSRWGTTEQQLECFLPALQAHGHPLPGRREGRRTVLDLEGLAVAGWMEHDLLQRAPFHTRLDGSTLPIKKDLLRVTHFTPVEGKPWRDQPVSAVELTRLLRQISTASFLVTAYLSGVRTGEALNLRRGCITQDAKLGLTFMSGQQMKTGPDRRERSPQTIPWVITSQVAQAVAVLEELAVGTVLFPPGKFCSHEWFTSSRSRTPGTINDDIQEFIGWFNTTIAHTVGHPIIESDEHGRISAPRLRRTLAWHIVRRPGGTVAGATQYGHLYTQITHGYAGQASSGFLDEITFEEFLMRAERLHEDHHRLTRGEHVSGPAAETYRDRVSAASRFTGLTITTPAQVNNALVHPDLQIHHGELLTCVYRHATAACRDKDDTDNGPSWPRCRLTCRNITYTDRDVAALGRHVQDLRADVGRPGLPEPLRRRIQARLEAHQRAIAEHETSRPQHSPEPTQDPS